MTADIFVPVFVTRETYERICKVSIKEAKTVPEVLSLAVQEISDRGWTDRVCVKGEL